MQQLIQRIMASRAMRAWQRYAEERGPVLSQGMTLQAFLSLFAALFVAFTVFVAVLGNNVVLRDAVIDSIAGAIPGLIGDNGAIDVDQLTQSRALDIAGVVAGLSILVTAIAWIAVSREGFRAMFGLGAPPSNAVVLKLGDLGVAVALGLLVLVSAGVLVVTDSLADALGLGWASGLVGIAVQIALDTAIVLLLFRFGGRLRLPAAQIVPAALVCALAFLALKLLASRLFGAVENNPLLAGIAAPVIILIWLGFIMQVLMLVLAYVAVGAHGRAYTRLVQAGGIDAQLTKADAKRLLEEVRANRRAGGDIADLNRRLVRKRR